MLIASLKCVIDLCCNC